VRSPNEEAFAESIVGRKILAVRRRAKWLLIELDGGLTLVAHLRMTGRWLLRRADAPADPYMRARLSLDGGEELRWSDLRKFGTWDLVSDPADVIGTVGPEPLEADFSSAALIAAAGGRHAPIKAFLLDQRRIAGLGNIYADEALWDAGIHPLRPAGSITADEAERLWAAIVAVLTDSLDSGGSSMRDYLDTAGRRGRFQERWRVYKREGTPCPRCGTEIVRIKVAGRGTRFCPSCQKASDPKIVTSEPAHLPG
jgi:formamidopyrimidine-DNA glycosylase